MSMPVPKDSSKPSQLLVLGTRGFFGVNCSYLFFGVGDLDKIKEKNQNIGITTKANKHQKQVKPQIASPNKVLDMRAPRR